MSEYIEYDDDTPSQSKRNFHQQHSSLRESQQNNNNNIRQSHLTAATSAGIRDSKIVYSDLSDTINAMRHRQSLLEGLRGSGMNGGAADIGAPPPAMMYKPGSADENASGFTKAFKRLASSWKKRKVSVNARAFMYDDVDNGKTVGALKLEEITQVKMINRQVMKERGCPENLRDFGWFLVGSGRQYIFACEDAHTRDIWVGFLNALIRQRNNDEQYLGDEAALTEGRSLSFGNGGGNTPSRGGTRLLGGGSGNNGNNNNNRGSNPPHDETYDPSPETLQAQEAVFDSVTNFKTK